MSLCIYGAPTKRQATSGPHLCAPWLHSVLTAALKHKEREAHFTDEKTEVWRPSRRHLAPGLEPCLSGARQCPGPTLPQGSLGLSSLPPPSPGLGASGLSTRSRHVCMSPGGLGGGQNASFTPALSPPHPAPYTLGAEATFGAGDMLPAILPTSSHHSPLSGVKKRGFHRVQGFARAPHLGQPRSPSPICCALCQGWRGTQRQCGFVEASTAYPSPDS